MTAAVIARGRTAKTGRTREIVTPEGIPLRFELAPAGERLGAYLIDFLIQIVAISVLLICIHLAGGTGEDSYLSAIAVVLSFFVRNFYFAIFEIRWQGATPGKRGVGIRVIDARGGQLENSAVLARNFIRELEIFTPLSILFAHASLWPGAPVWALLLAGAWAFVFFFFPLFNRDRLRIGDLIAGTIVVVQPKALLAPDLVDERAAHALVTRKPAFEFTEQQLGVYGIYELQVLEGLLRQHAGVTGYLEGIAAVTEKIRAKLDYTDPIDDAERFLRDFYAALRAHLEQRLLFGQRREDKYAKKK